MFHTFKKCSKTARLILAVYSWQILGLPALAIADDLTQAQSYTDAYNKAVDSKNANTIAVGVWGAAAAVCGYNCVNYLWPFRTDRSKIGTDADALASAVKTAAATCPVLSPYVTVMSDSAARIKQNLADGDSATAKATTDSKKGVGDLKKDAGATDGNSNGASARDSIPSLWTLEVAVIRGSVQPLPHSIYLSLIPLPVLFASALQGDLFAKTFSYTTLLTTAGPGETLTADEVAQNQKITDARAAEQSARDAQAAQDAQSGSNAQDAAKAAGEKQAAAQAGAADKPLDSGATSSIKGPNGEELYSDGKGGLYDGFDNTYDASGNPSASPAGAKPVVAPAVKPGAQVDKSSGATKDKTKATADDNPTVGPDEGLAANAKKMAALALKAAAAADAASKSTTAVPGANIATAGCKAAPTPIRGASGTLTSSVTKFQGEIEAIVSTGTWCSSGAVVAGVTDAGLSFGMAKDTTAGIIGLAGAAPGVYGLASSMLKKETSSDASTAATAGITSCITMATSLAEVAVKVVGMKSAQDSMDQNNKSLEELQSTSWLEWFLQVSPLGVLTAHAAVDSGIQNACSAKVMHGPAMGRYSCGLAGDDKLRTLTARMPGGGNGLFTLEERLFGISREDFLSTKKPLDMNRVIGLITRGAPDLAPRLSLLYASMEGKVLKYNKMNPAQQRQLLADSPTGPVNRTPGLMGNQSTGAAASFLGASAVAGDAFAMPMSPSAEPDDSYDINRAPASAGAAAQAALPPPPGLGPDEISPAGGRTLFELVSRTIRDHRELIQGD